MFNFLGEEISIKQTIRKHLVTEVLSSNLKKKGVGYPKSFYNYTGQNRNKIEKTP